jgi:hypothetical protein
MFLNCSIVQDVPTLGILLDKTTSHSSPIHSPERLLSIGESGLLKPNRTTATEII